MFLRLILLSFCLFSPALTSLCAAEAESSNWFYRAWQTEDGLPDNSISDLAQSPDGYLWVATKGGLMRFNGAEFATMPLHRLPGLPSRAVRAMFLDSRGRVWFAMERGPLIRAGVDSVHPFFPADGLPTQRVIGITEDGQGTIWACFSGEVCYIEGDSITTLGEAEGLLRGGSPSLASDSFGNVWLSIGGMLGQLSKEGFSPLYPLGDLRATIAPAGDGGLWITANSKLMRLPVNGDPASVTSLPDDSRANVIYEDPSGTVWIGTSGHGLFRFDGGVLKAIPTSHPDIECITEDREGNIWAGTSGGGLNLIKPLSVELIEEPNQAFLTSAQSVSIGSNGRIWAVTERGGLVSGSNGRWRSESGGQVWSGTLASCVAADQNGRVWVGTRDKGILVHHQDKWQVFPLDHKLKHRVVRSLLAASNGDIWAAFDTPFQVHRIRNGQATNFPIDGPIEFIRAMTEGPGGTIWIGSSDGRVLRATDDRLVDETAITEPLPLSVRTLQASPDGSLWIGYAGEGLGHLKDGRYTRLTKADGLYDDYISQIIDDHQGSLWITANRGLFQLDYREVIDRIKGGTNHLRPRTFGRNDGLPSLQPVRNFSPSAARAPDGTLWFSMSRGLLKVQPDQIKSNPIPPPVVLEQVILDDEVVAFYQTRSLDPNAHEESRLDLSKPEPRLRIDPGHDKMEIRYAALSLTSPENIHFLHRLKPFDRNWVQTTSGQSATYPRLPAGRYEFQVLACNNVGVWNEHGATLEITVDPYFWETWWFKIGGGIGTALAAGGLVFLWLRWRHKRQLQQIAEKRALEQERSRIARDIHDDLGASLTHITLLSQSTPTPDTQLTQEVLDQIHATARHLMRSMEEVVWAVNPDHDTFDALANYISNYGQGFLSIAGVRCRLEMPMVLPERPLSAQVRHNLFLAFKEALNNSVKYSEATEVRISLRPDDTHFVLRIADNGRGFDLNSPSDPTRNLPGNGLANMKTRMAEIGGTCTLSSSDEEGTSVEFEVPFRMNP
ncbi:two-component regulator propeller domain-containing protein [Haloferula chungangensis]|uniref:Two-component regulator propeller domain-containing protein n=1 Tax=Haloferula chungangensis TaxID=1048331 RepID=A0ABW2L026_9BACT